MRTGKHRLAPCSARRLRLCFALILTVPAAMVGGAYLAGNSVPPTHAGQTQLPIVHTAVLADPAVSGAAEATPTSNTRPAKPARNRSERSLDRSQGLLGKPARRAARSVPHSTSATRSQASRYAARSALTTESGSGR